MKFGSNNLNVCCDDYQFDVIQSKKCDEVVEFDKKYRNAHFDDFFPEFRLQYSCFWYLCLLEVALYEQSMDTIYTPKNIIFLRSKQKIGNHQKTKFGSV